MSELSDLREQVQKLTEENERLQNSAEDVLSHACRGVAETRAHEAEAQLTAAETQRDTLRTALIEAQSWIEGRHALSSVVPILARIREALEAPQ